MYFIFLFIVVAVGYFLLDFLMNFLGIKSTVGYFIGGIILFWLAYPIVVMLIEELPEKEQESLKKK